MNTSSQPSTRQAGFSLVEVVVALGLVSFCLLAVFSLLPLGLRTVKNAEQESAAASSYDQLVNSIRNATTNASGAYVANGAYSNITWTLGSSSPVQFTTKLDLSGQPAADADARLVAHVEVLAPSADRSTPGRARISVAWPVAATWSTASNTWARKEGAVTSGIQFLPSR